VREKSRIDAGLPNDLQVAVVEVDLLNSLVVERRLDATATRRHTDLARTRGRRARRVAVALVMVPAPPDRPDKSGQPCRAGGEFLIRCYSRALADVSPSLIEHETIECPAQFACGAPYVS
jgi:hypothetical protein